MVNIWPDRAIDATCIKDAFAKAEEIVKAIAPIYEYDGKKYIILEFEVNRVKTKPSNHIHTRPLTDPVGVVQNVYVNYLLLKKKIYAALQYSAAGKP